MAAWHPVQVCVCAGMRVVRVCLRVCVFACACVRACVHSLAQGWPGRSSWMWVREVRQLCPCPLPFPLLPCVCVCVAVCVCGGVRILGCRVTRACVHMCVRNRFNM